jgi:hypothetical protein
MDGEVATQLYFTIFDMIPFIYGKIDHNAFLAKVPPNSTLYLINPVLGNKWRLDNATHISMYGIDQSKSLIVN